MRHLLTLLAVLMTTAAPGAQIIDRVLAVVGGAPITLSDVTAAARLGLVPSGEPADDVALNALIERQLQLIEVNRYQPPEPTEPEIDARLAELRTRLQTEAALDAALEETGVTPSELRAHIRNTLRIESYLQQRFGAGYTPSEEEILRYYRVNSGEFVRAGAVRPYAEVRDDARRRLAQTRSEQLVRDWIAGLRRRADVTILPR
jgi:hypothetical protein